MKAHAPYESVLASDAMPGAVWFPGARLNFAEHLLGTEEDAERVAVVARSQTREPVELTFGELREQVARARAGLQRLGVGPGDRVVAYLPNIPETLVAFAATASLGAVWASCAPELGPRSVVDRLVQLEPAVLLTVGGYGFRDRSVDRRDEVAAIRAALPTLRHVVHVPYGEHVVPDAVSWDELLAEPGPARLRCRSRSTTRCSCSSRRGRPAGRRRSCTATAASCSSSQGARVQLGPEAGQPPALVLDDVVDDVERAVAALLVRSSIVMLDGDPAWPDLGWQWRVAEETRADVHGRRARRS